MDFRCHRGPDVGGSRWLKLGDRPAFARACHSAISLGALSHVGRKIAVTFDDHGAAAFSTFLFLFWSASRTMRSVRSSCFRVRDLPDVSRVLRQFCSVGAIPGRWPWLNIIFRRAIVGEAPPAHSADIDGTPRAAPRAIERFSGGQDQRCAGHGLDRTQQFSAGRCIAFIKYHHSAAPTPVFAAPEAPILYEGPAAPLSTGADG